MKSLLKKLHIMPDQSSDDTSSKGGGGSGGGSSRSPTNLTPLHSDTKPLSGLSGWLNSVTSKNTSTSPTSTSSSSSSSPFSLSPLNAGRERKEQGAGSGSHSLAASEVMLKTVGVQSESSQQRNPNMEEEYQIQIALELSAREDPEAVQIEAVKQISLGSCLPQNTSAEVIAYRYWNYDALSYDDKILDGFYDLYGVVADSNSVKMPSLIDLQGMPVSDRICWEAILVNRAGDTDLLKLEQKALMMALKSRSGPLGIADTKLVQKLAVLVADCMGGAVGDPENLLKEWKKLGNHLRASIGSMVFPLGRLTIGLARHRALLFKVLADSVGVPCRLVKGQQYTGSDDGAINIVKVNDGREYIVDLMADPGTLISSDPVLSQQDFDVTFFASSPPVRDNDFLMATSNSGASSSVSHIFENEKVDNRTLSSNIATSESEISSWSNFQDQENQKLCSSCEQSSTKESVNDNSKTCTDFNVSCSDQQIPSLDVSVRPNHSYPLVRSPSWTEGVSFPAVSRMKVNDVSQYMIDAAKVNPQLAQKLHDVLLESGVVAPPNLFSEMCADQPESPMALDTKLYEDKNEFEMWKNGIKQKSQTDESFGLLFPRHPNPYPQPKVTSSKPKKNILKSAEGLGFHHPLDFREVAEVPSTSQCEVSISQLQSSPIQMMTNLPVAAAAAAAAVVASSMVVAAAKSNAEANLDVPVVATAAVVATTAAVSKQYEQLESFAPLLTASCKNINRTEINCEDDSLNEQAGSVHGIDSGPRGEQDASEVHQEAERNSDKSSGNESVKSDFALDDVAELEIPWEEIILGERIGLGSYGEVYHGDWHGTEVAVKRFLHQDISGDALEEFRSEVRIMKRLRHPNVVLLMGAVTRVPNLSIVTEFLPRGSLYRLIHRPNNQLDERRRLRMALDVARGMNYLHNCTPVIVHRDLKSPNLLVDKNWVVKVCDFGLSRMKHNTFLSSRSTAGTAEWMAPEVLRNEPSDEKCDVYSYGVILWEICTLQKPWGGMNPMQVVGAVGFQHRHLDIPDDMDPVIADTIGKCWRTDPKLRPSFSEIMAILKPLQKSTAGTQVLSQRVGTPNRTAKTRTTSQGTEEA